MYVWDFEGELGPLCLLLCTDVDLLFLRLSFGRLKLNNQKWEMKTRHMLSRESKELNLIQRTS